MMFIARFTSPKASAIGFPSSVVMVRAISSPRRPKISNALNSTEARTGAGVLAQLAAASLAAATAAAVSSKLEVWNSPTDSVFLAGL